MFYTLWPIIIKYNIFNNSRPWWSRSNVVASSSRVRGFKTQLRSMDFFRTLKSWAPFLREGLQARGPESEISDSLEKLKPEKIGLGVKFNRHIPRPSNTWIRGSTIDLDCIALGSNGHLVNTIEYYLTKQNISPWYLRHFKYVGGEVVCDTMLRQ